VFELILLTSTPRSKFLAHKTVLSSSCCGIGSARIYLLHKLTHSFIWSIFIDLAILSFVINSKSLPLRSPFSTISIAGKSNFSGNYNDLEDAPNITEDNSGNLVITDKDGNIVFRSDGNGFETTTLTVQDIILEGDNIEEVIRAEIQSYIDEAILGGAW
jgi:hypothetical protein